MTGIAETREKMHREQRTERRKFFYGVRRTESWNDAAESEILQSRCKIKLVYRLNFAPFVYHFAFRFSGIAGYKHPVQLRHN